MKLVKPTLADVLYITHNMREWDRREILAMQWSDDLDELAMAAMRWGNDFAWVATKDHLPVAYIGAGMMWPGVWSVWMYATDRFPLIGLALTRFVRRCMIPAVKGAGFHLGICWSIEGHQTAHRWLEALGATRGSPMPGYGKGGETFIPFTWR
jgi:hypothetical protein